MSAESIRQHKSQERGQGKEFDIPKSDSPPTNATCAGEHRRRRLVPKSRDFNPLKYRAWLTGHLICIGFGIVSLMFQLFRFPAKWWVASVVYRLSLVGAVIALTATFSHKFGLHYLPLLSLLLSQQNFQFLVLALAWMGTYKSVFKLAPFVAISSLQLADKYDVKVICEAAPQISVGILACEACLAITLLLRTFLFKSTSGYQLALYVFFYWLRVLFDPATRINLKTQVDRLGGFAKGKNQKAESIIEFILKNLEAQSSEGKAILADMTKRQ